MNALKEKILRLIAQTGPISVAQYMQIALSDPEHGYYMRGDPLGKDFITAPEVSQIFGELLGLFFVQAWEDRGRPARFHFVELGPGRGTLMADMLRAAEKVRPNFVETARIILVETSPSLKRIQEETLALRRVTWLTRFEEVSGDVPLFLIANEFFDALPIRQFVRSERGWHERMIIAEGENLKFALAPDVVVPSHPLAAKPAPLGSIVEINPAADALARQIGERFDEQDGVALIIDYGYAQPSFGDTLQAVKNNAFADPLTEPGEADLTAHVDFSALKRAGHALGPITQRELLERLGIEARAERLKKENPGKATDIDAAVERLTAPKQMGTLFKALAIFEDRETPPGFEDAH
ncbi:MAG TPA: SAM-dependent methyltransferase [Micropepsaceae bacterium]|nr:SAM-dependent methyltransferase [Micropepsaceae bacterium]